MEFILGSFQPPLQKIDNFRGGFYSSCLPSKTSFFPLLLGMPNSFFTIWAVLIFQPKFWARLKSELIFLFGGSQSIMRPNLGDFGPLLKKLDIFRGYLHLPRFSSPRLTLSALTMNLGNLCPLEQNPHNSWQTHNPWLIHYGEQLQEHSVCANRLFKDVPTPNLTYIHIYGPIRKFRATQVYDKMGTHINIFYIIRIIISWIINSYFIYEYTPGLAEEMEQQELKK